MRNASGTGGPAEILPFHQFKYEPVGNAGFLHSVNRCDIGVVQRSQSPRFTAQAREAVGIARKLGGQRLHGDVPTEFRIARPINLAHPASAQE
jgi:hypothetical protein